MTRRTYRGRKPRLTAEQAAAIREWAAIGTTRSEVARRFGINVKTIGAYIRDEIKNYQSRVTA